MGKRLVNKAVEEKILSNSEKEVLLSSGFTPMQIVTIISKRFDSAGKRGIEYIVEELSNNKDINLSIAKQIAKYLSAYNATIVTTNADETLENTKPLNDRKVIKSFVDYDDENNRDYSFIHLHGSISEPENMVFTSEDYAKAYSVERIFGIKLKKLMDYKWTILFVGYGVSEFELIRYFLNDDDSKDRRLFMLDGYLYKDLIKYEFDKEYFKSLGIYLLPYSREKDNYNALINVLKKWDKIVETKTFASTSRKVSIINKIVSNMPTDENVQIIEKLVNNNE